MMHELIYLILLCMKYGVRMKVSVDKYVLNVGVRMGVIIGISNLGVRMPCHKFISRPLTCSSLGEKLVYTKEGYIK